MKPYYYLFLISCCFISCKKYLDAKPDKKLEIPDKISDVQALLDNESIMALNDPATGEISADNYYVTDSDWARIYSVSERNMYIWASDITLNDLPNHWSILYQIVGVANVALESIDKITPGVNEQDAWNNVKGSALLYRSKAFLVVAGLWAKVYDANTAESDPGIPLRLSSDYLVKTTRSIVKQTYDRIINDLKEAAPLLPAHPAHVMRPSRAAAFGLLARTYLMMSAFDSAEVYAEKCLSINSGLLDYNSLDTNSSSPVPRFNVEVIMHSKMPVPGIFYNRAKVDSVLYRSYSDNDLRKKIFFSDNGDSTYWFKGSYDHSIALFDGVATDEIYLIKAECLAREGNNQDAIITLNTLLVNRWKEGTFIPFSATDAHDALEIILRERRKELIFRGLRWTDLKRLNKEPAFQQTIQRKLNGVEYKLEPGDNRYALPIPQSVINISGIEQNPR